MGLPMRAEKFHYWPWTYPANLFGLVISSAGAFGLISSYRRSYASIFIFLTLSLLSTIFCGFLIIYYSIVVSYYNTISLNILAYTSDSINTAYGFACTNFFLTVVSLLFSIFSIVSCLLGIKGFTPKGMDEVNEKQEIREVY